MPLKDVWNSTCLRVYDAWEEGGAKWVIQDLAPEDEDTGIQLLVENLLKDEQICSLHNFYYDEESLNGMLKFWQRCLAQKLSIGCYNNIDGERNFVALHVCVIDTLGDIKNIELKGNAWQQLYGAKKYVQLKCDAFKYLQVDKILHSCGLVVRREYRGLNLASRMLSARRPLCARRGLKASSTVVTGPASQRAAAKAGFETIAEASWEELAESGFKFPKDETKIIKWMVQKYILYMERVVQFQVFMKYSKEQYTYG